MLNHWNNDGPLNRWCWDNYTYGHVERDVNLTPRRSINYKWVNRSRISMQKEGEKGGVGGGGGGPKRRRGEEMAQVPEENMNEFPL